MSEEGLKNKTIIVGVTGSIAAYKAAELVSRLRRAGCDVVVVMTGDACHFVGPITFGTLSGNPVVTGLFSEVADWNPLHVSLADRADVVAVVPATANVIGKVAAGIADDALTCLVMAARKPVLFAPAMNVNMYGNRIVQENIAKLKELGYRFIDPEEGYLACGYEGKGRLASTDSIVAGIEKLLRQ